MDRKHTVIVVFMFTTCLGLHAQQTFYHTHGDQTYQRALELYENGKYSAAQQFFDSYTTKHAGENSELVSNSEFYSSLCALKLFNNDAESRVTEFLNGNPDNPLRNEAALNLANYLYQRKSYNRALNYYELVDKKRLKSEDLPEYEFKKGYCYFLRDDFNNARYAFSQVINSGSKYKVPALYYYGHINYAQANYETALEAFMQIRDDENFGPIVPYYLTQIYFKQQKYDEVVKYAPAMMENVTEKRSAEVSRIIGESYIELNLYKEAIPYLENYMKTSGKITREDRYSLAYAYYKTGNYQQAAALFAQVTGSDSQLSQNALYHMADCQLKLGDKNKARMAFSSAAKLSFDPEISEDALFNYALLTYELDYSPFNEAVQALNEYLDKYPNAKRTDEAGRYLVLAYMNAKNYRLALASIDKIRNKSTEIQKAYQKIAFYRGLELFSNLNFSDAVELLSSSTRYGNFDNRIYALSFYWKGEAYYREGDFRKAVDNYNTFLAQTGISKFDEYALAHYNLGYCYFSLKQYADAALWFSRFTSKAAKQSSELITDAYNRLGDCYFIRQEYAASIAFYDKAVQSGKGNVDYAMLQKGMVLGILGRDSEKIATLNQLAQSYPKSTYQADLLFQSAESYVKLNQYEKAIEMYKKVISEYPKSSYVKKSLLNLGLLYFNSNRNDEAIRCYKQVLADYPGTDEAENALIGLKNVYVDMNDVDSYYAYVKSLGVLTASDLIEQDSLSYLAAEKIYMTGDYEKAARSLKSYIDKHPDGRFLLNAHFYYGDCNYRANNNAEALVSFDYVIGRPQNRFTEPALLGASRIKLREKDYGAAAEYFRKLEEVAEVKSNLLESRMGLLKCYYLLEDYSRVIETADKILLAEKLSPEQERETRFLKAKSLLARDRQMLALEEFKKVAVEVKSAEGAESKYRIAEILYQRKELDQAEKEISEFADKTTPHQYWMAMCFMLWADIFRDKGDDFQAIQTLQSLIDYYENSDDGIITKAMEKKKLLTDKQESAGKNDKQQDVEIEVKD
jgi:tetratricopeptide (TPR) repeat protein